MSKPRRFHQSDYTRVAQDDYQTIDPRTVEALMATWPIGGKVVDVCSPMGSGIVEHMNNLGGVIASGAADAFAPVDADWVVTNPPYKRKLVDQIVGAQVDRVRRGEIYGFASLMRPAWDMDGIGEGRPALFDGSLYAGQTKLRFRPWWTTDRKAKPQHHSIWHIWMRERPQPEPVTRYWPKAS